MNVYYKFETKVFCLNANKILQAWKIYNSHDCKAML